MKLLYHVDVATIPNGNLRFPKIEGGQIQTIHDLNATLKNPYLTALQYLYLKIFQCFLTSLCRITSLSFQFRCISKFTIIEISHSAKMTTLETVSIGAQIFRP